MVFQGSYNQVIFSQYSSGDIVGYLTLGKDENLKLYVEYFTKENILKPMVITPITIHKDHVLVSDVSDSNRTKRLNFDGIFRIGIENKNA